MMDAAAADASKQPAGGPAGGTEDSRSGLIYNDDTGRAAPPGEPQRWNY